MLRGALVSVIQVQRKVLHSLWMTTVDNAVTSQTRPWFVTWRDPVSRADCNPRQEHAVAYCASAINNLRAPLSITSRISLVYNNYSTFCFCFDFLAHTDANYHMHVLKSCFIVIIIVIISANRRSSSAYLRDGPDRHLPTPVSVARAVTTVTKTDTS